MRSVQAIWCSVLSRDSRGSCCMRWLKGRCNINPRCRARRESPTTLLRQHGEGEVAHARLMCAAGGKLSGAHMDATLDRAALFGGRTLCLCWYPRERVEISCRVLTPVER